MSKVSNLEPTIVWKFFGEITKVPRPSKKEKRIVEYLVDFAKEHDLEIRRDEIGNVVILRPATLSKKDSPTVILQGHMDMVCEKNSDVEFDFDNSPIDTYVEDGWVKARGTTLGADNGIGMAAAMAALVSTEIETPAIEALFTVDEETGLTGAYNLGEHMLTGRYLLNLDSSDDGEIFIGCSGGVDTLGTFTYIAEQSPSGYDFHRIDVAGLKGGHSGDDINKGHANSNKVTARILLRLADKLELRLASFDGGNLRNAIPREAHAIFGVPIAKTAQLIEFFSRLSSEIKAEFQVTEPEMRLTLSKCAAAKQVIDLQSQSKVLNTIQALRNGVLAMSFSMSDLVETSTNLASVKFEKNNTIVITTSQRSSIDSARMDAAASVASALKLGGATVKHSEGYPGWTPNPSSELLTIAQKSHKELFGVDAQIKAIHAGLECGLFLQKFPNLEMISFGPTIRGAHSPDEKLEVEAVDKFWRLLKSILAKM